MSESTSFDFAAHVPPELIHSIVEEAVGKQLREAIAGSGDIGTLVATLKANSLWPAFARLPLAALGVGGNGFTEAPAPAPAAPAPAPVAAAAEPVAPPAKPVSTRGRKPAAKAAPAAKPEGHGKFVRRSSKDIEKTVGKVLGFVSRNPGLRSEEIVKKMGGDAKAISDALARLRAEKKVTTEGEKRATRYTAA